MSLLTKCHMFLSWAFFVIISNLKHLWTMPQNWRKINMFLLGRNPGWIIQRHHWWLQSNRLLQTKGMFISTKCGDSRIIYNIAVVFLFNFLVIGKKKTSLTCLDVSSVILLQRRNLLKPWYVWMIPVHVERYFWHDTDFPFVAYIIRDPYIYTVRSLLT